MFVSFSQSISVLLFQTSLKVCQEINMTVFFFVKVIFEIFTFKNSNLFFLIVIYQNLIANNYVLKNCYTCRYKSRRLVHYKEPGYGTHHCCGRFLHFCTRNPGLLDHCYYNSASTIFVLKAGAQV